MTAKPLIGLGGKKFTSVDDIPADYFARPPSILVPVTPADATPFPTGIARGLNVKTAGLATLLLADGVTTVAIWLSQGNNDFMVAGVNATNLGAAGITALY